MERWSGGLLASDIDGTLTEFAEIPRRNVEAIRAFQAGGGRFTVATARIPALLRDVTEVVALNAPAICLNGACLYDAVQDRVLAFRGLPEGAKAALPRLMERFPGAGVLVVGLERYHILREGAYVDETLGRRLEARRRAGDYVDAAPEDLPERWAKCVFMVSGPDMGRMVRACQPELDALGLALVSTSDYYLELVGTDWNKGSALAGLARRLGTPVGRTGAVGDQMNDVDLLRAAGWRAVVAGAPAQLTALADLVTCPCGQGAVADALEGYQRFLEGGPTGDRGHRAEPPRPMA